MFNQNYIHAAKSQLDGYLQQLQELRGTIATERDIANLYGTSVFLYATSLFWADAVSGADFIVYKNGVPVGDAHPLQQLLNTQGDLWRRSELCRMMWGRNLIWKRRNMAHTRIWELRWINPLIYNVNATRGGLRDFRIYASANSDIDVRTIYPPDAIFQHEIDFFDDYDGVAPAETAFLQASAEVELATTALSWFRNSLFMGGIFQPTADEREKSDTNVNNLLGLLRRLFRGARNAGRTLVQNARWEYIQLQQDFDKVALSETYASIRQNVSIATNVPVEFVTTGETTYAEIRGKIQLWYQLRLKPVLGRYADTLTKQLASEWGDDYKVEADITPLMISDPKEQSEIIDTQVQGGYLDLYTAQQQLGHKEPDPRLKGLYMVNGLPVPAEQMTRIWEFQLGGSSLLAQATPVIDVMNMRRSTPLDAEEGTTLPLLPGPSQNYIPDAQYKELQNWQHLVSRKGEDYAFEIHELPDKAVKFVRWGLSVDAPIEDVFASAGSFLRSEYDDRWLVDSFLACERANKEASKSIDDTRADWIRTISPIMRELDAQTLGAPRAQILMHSEIERFGRMAYLDGLISGGIPDAQMTLQDFRALSTLTTRQKQYASKFINRVLREGIGDISAKALEWFNGSIYPFFIEGQQNGKDNPNEIWVMNPAKENCGSCKALNGQIHRRSTWNQKSLYPNSNRLLCGKGNHCGCQRKVTAEKARGRFLSAGLLASDLAH